MNVKIGVVLGLAVVILVVVSQALFTVDEREQVIIIQLGEYIRSIDEPGLHFRLPFIQSVQRLERRVLLSDVPATEFLTLDKERLVIDSYTRWRIIDPHLFFKAVRDERGAKLRIDGIVISKLREQLAEHVLWDIIGPQREPIMETVAQHVDGITQREFGIKVIDVRMKRVDLPEEVQRAVFARMVAERERIAKEHRAEGAQAARKLVAAADREVVVLRAEAERKAKELRGKGDAEAIKIYAQAFEKGPELYAFLRSLEAYEKALAGDTTLVFSSDAEFFRYLGQTK